MTIVTMAFVVDLLAQYHSSSRTMTTETNFFDQSLRGIVIR